MKENNAKKPFLNADIRRCNADGRRYAPYRNLRKSAFSAKKLSGSASLYGGDLRQSALKNNFSMGANLTEFQFRVFKIVSKIPFGKIRTYKWVAQKIGKPKAHRAVGQALKSNPYPFVIPCHRVIKSDGAIGGYIFGVSLKKELLSLEEDISKSIKN
ncbi:MAG: MGMT family protein [Candidatus Omnitrophica bacterium]|nr:MGMT family protein [Candidatus Omnitrophota bacterium]